MPDKLRAREVRLRFHSVSVQVTSRYRSLIEELEHDFFYFLDPAPHKPDFILTHVDGNPPPSWLPWLWLANKTLFLPGDGERRVGFFGQAWVGYAFSHGRARVFADDADVAYETVYLTLLSYVGEALDRKGIHRLHGLGMAHGEDGVVALGASGTGKSTLAYGLLGQRNHKLLSDDIALVDRLGNIYAFPLRIGLRERPNISSDGYRVFKRAEHGEKFVIGASRFCGLVKPQVALKWLVLLERTTEPLTKIEALSPLATAFCLFRWLVIGHETPQIWPLFIRFTPQDLWAKTKIFFSRCRVALVLLRRAHARRFSLSTNVNGSTNSFSLWLQEPA